MKTSYKWFFVLSFISVCLGSLLFISPLPLYYNKEETQLMGSGKEPDTQKANEAIQTFGAKNNCPQKSIQYHDEHPIFQDDGWEMLWRDEFESECLDHSKWNMEDWAADKNNELQYYNPNNVLVKDGVLKLISKDERFRGKEYTSGAVQTKNKFNLLYGKVEMRAKLPAGQGIFPAFWMLTDNDDTWLPEIDIMEMLGQRPDEIWMVSHWLGADGKLKSVSNTFKGPDFSKDFHRFSIEWTPDSLRWIIDGVERFKTARQIPNEPMYLYLNTAVGGNWPDSPDNTTIFPAVYEIDYVRVFKNQKEGLPEEA